ncbi:MAG: DUF167 domain-containing protein [Pseudomonadota bacterium]
MPGASSTTIVGWLGDALKIRVAEPAEKGRANAAVVRLLARALAVPESEICIVAGATAARKTVLINSLTLAECRQRLASVGV